jgi:hypothetical protein
VQTARRCSACNVATRHRDGALPRVAIDLGEEVSVCGEEEGALVPPLPHLALLVRALRRVSFHDTASVQRTSL